MVGFIAFHLSSQLDIHHQIFMLKGSILTEILTFFHQLCFEYIDYI